MNAGTYIVQLGDTLTSIAARLYGDPEAYVIAGLAADTVIKQMIRQRLVHPKAGEETE